MASSKYFGKFIHALMIYSELSPLFRKVDSAKKQENTKCSRPLEFKSKKSRFCWKHLRSVIPDGGEKVGGLFFLHSKHFNLQQVWHFDEEKKGRSLRNVEVGRHKKFPRKWALFVYTVYTYLPLVTAL